MPHTYSSSMTKYPKKLIYLLNMRNISLLWLSVTSRLKLLSMSACLGHCSTNRPSFVLFWIMICRLVTKISFLLLPSSSGIKVRLMTGRRSTPSWHYSRYQNPIRAHIRSICIKKPPCLSPGPTTSPSSPSLHYSLIAQRKSGLPETINLRRNNTSRHFVTISSASGCPIILKINGKEPFFMPTHHNASLRCASSNLPSSMQIYLQK